MFAIRLLKKIIQVLCNSDFEKIDLNQMKWDENLENELKKTKEEIKNNFHHEIRLGNYENSGILRMKR